jgi:hypothetical protein
MILVDTSVWVDHFRTGDPAFAELLRAELVLMHPFVAGELACGNLRKRQAILNDIAALPQAVLVDHHDVLRLIEERRLWGKGIGWIDGHLLASALVSGACLWTLDSALGRAARALAVEFR